MFLQTQHASALQRSGGAGGAPLAPGGDSGPGLGPGLLLHLERSGVDRKGQPVLTSLLLQHIRFPYEGDLYPSCIIKTLKLEDRSDLNLRADLWIFRKRQRDLTSNYPGCALGSPPPSLPLIFLINASQSKACV